MDASAVVFGNADLNISIKRMVVDDTELFTGVFFGNSGSMMDIQNSCLLEGSNQAAVYMSEESNFTAAVVNSEGVSPPAVPIPAVVIEIGDKKAGIIVDSLVGQQHIVIKSFGSLLKGIRGFEKSV